MKLSFGPKHFGQAYLKSKTRRARRIRAKRILKHTKGDSSFVTRLKDIAR